MCFAKFNIKLQCSICAMFQTKSSLEVAVEAAARVDAVLAKKGKIKPNPISSAFATANKSTTDLFQTEFEINDVPLTARNLLTKGITQEEINHFSGASISTRGRYVTTEDRPKLPKSERPLYLFIQGPNKQSLDLAIQRIDSLIKEVMEQEKFKMGVPPPMIPMQTSLPGMEKVIVGLDMAPPSFDLRNKVLGPSGANLQYISNETGAVVTLRGRGSGYPEAPTGHESTEPLHISVEHQTMEVLQAARQLAFNLVDTIHQECAQIHPDLIVQPGQVPLQSEHLPPGVVAAPTQVPIVAQPPTPVSQLVNMPPPSLTVPPPQLAQQPPPTVNLPPPGIHIPAHQGPLVPTPQGIVQQHIVQQQLPTNPPTQSLQYIQTANGQTLMAYQAQPQVKADTSGQVQLIQPGQPQQLQLIPGTQQLLMQQPQQQVTMLLQYQQQNEPGKGGRLVGGQQRLATPVQIQLQPGMQLINPQLLQSGQTQFQLQLQQPLAQQLLQQAVRSVTPQQHILQLQQLPLQQQLQLQQQSQQPLQHQLQQSVQTQFQQLQQPQQQTLQQLQQVPPQQQLQQAPTQQQLQQVPQQQQQHANQQVQPQQHLQQTQQLQQSQQQLQQQHIQLSQQQIQQLQQLQQPQQYQQTQQVAQQQIQSQQHQNIQQLQLAPQQGQMKLSQLRKETHNQNGQQSEKPNQDLPTQHSSPNRTSQTLGHKRRYEDEQHPLIYQGTPQPVPPPKMAAPKVTPPKQASASGVGNEQNTAQKPATTAIQQLLPQIQKQLMPPPPPPQQGAPDDWRNNQQDQISQANRGESHSSPQGGRPTFNHYSSKPQLYNANMPFHMQGLGAYPPPPPPPPPAISYYQQPQTNQYPYFMMHQQQ